jgi:hypothetical protein
VGQSRASEQYQQITLLDKRRDLKIDQFNLSSSFIKNRNDRNQLLNPTPIIDGHPLSHIRGGPTIDHALPLKSFYADH